MFKEHFESECAYKGNLMLHVNHFSCTLHSPYTLISTKYVIHVIVKERTAIRTRLIVSHFCVSFYTGRTLNFLGRGRASVARTSPRETN